MQVDNDTAAHKAACTQLERTDRLSRKRRFIDGFPGIRPHGKPDFQHDAGRFHETVIHSAGTGPAENNRLSCNHAETVFEIIIAERQIVRLSVAERVQTNLETVVFPEVSRFSGIRIGIQTLFEYGDSQIEEIIIPCVTEFGAHLFFFSPQRAFSKTTAFF